MRQITEEEYHELAELLAVATKQIKELNALVARIPKYAEPEVTCHSQLEIGKMYWLQNRKTFDSAVERCKGDKCVKATKGFYGYGNWNEDEDTLTENYRIFELKFSPK